MPHSDARPEPHGAAADRLRRLLGPDTSEPGDTPSPAPVDADRWVPWGEESSSEHAVESDEPGASPSTVDLGAGAGRPAGVHRAAARTRARQRSDRLASPGSGLRDAIADRLPVTLRSGAVAISGPASIGLTLVAVLAVVVVVVLWHSGRPEVRAAPPRLVASGPTPASSGPTSGAGVQPAGSRGTQNVVGAGGSTPTAQAPTSIMVDVAGRVRHPGVVELRSGARVVDAIEAAGGALADADLRPLNLAQMLSDGEQVLVLGEGEAVAGAAGSGVSGGAGGPGAEGGGSPGSTATGARAPGSPVDLNSATAADLDALPGVGPVLAQRIVDWRQQHGRFSNVEELQEVSGIGAAKYDDLKILVSV